MIVDTSALIAFFDRNEPDHAAVSAVIEQATDGLVVSPYVLAEVDYLLSTRFGVVAELRALAELTSGAWELAHVDLSAARRATKVISTYSDQLIGIADASLVVLADQWHTRTIATLDRRHFEVLRPLTGGRFTLVP